MNRRIDWTLYLVTDPGLARGRPMGEIVRAAVEGGVTVVQIRDKGGTSRALYEEALEMRRLLDALNRPLIVNDRLDIALAVGAAGVHLGQGDLPCAAARRIAGRRMVIGVSVSTVDEAVAAERDGADYVSVSPVFPTPTKTDTPAPAGLAGLRAIRLSVALPVVAIGGANAGNAADLVAAGADGVAVVSAIMSASDPRGAAKEILQAIRRGRAVARCGADKEPQ